MKTCVCIKNWEPLTSFDGFQYGFEVGYKFKYQFDDKYFQILNGRNLSSPVRACKIYYSDLRYALSSVDDFKEHFIDIDEYRESKLSEIGI